MAFPDARTLALLRTGAFGVAKFLVDTCDIYRTGASGRAALATSEPCLINDYAPGTNPLLSENNLDVGLYVLTTLYSRVLHIKDEIVHNGFHYEVYELLEDKSPAVFRQARIRKTS